MSDLPEDMIYLKTDYFHVVHSGSQDVIYLVLMLLSQAAGTAKDMG